jgi:hypothetical protein
VRSVRFSQITVALAPQSAMLDLLVSGTKAVVRRGKNSARNYQAAHLCRRAIEGG